MSSRDTNWITECERFQCERHIFPPYIRHILHRRVRRYFPLLVCSHSLFNTMYGPYKKKKMLTLRRDKDAKHRLKGYPSVHGTIPATAFNRNGSIFAYAVSYDWSKGHQSNNLGYPIKVMLHPIKDDEAKPKPAVKKR